MNEKVSLKPQRHSCPTATFTAWHQRPKISTRPSRGNSSPRRIQGLRLSRPARRDRHGPLHRRMERQRSVYKDVFAEHSLAGDVIPRYPPSRLRDLHPERLTDPCLSRSTHTARAPLKAAAFHIGLENIPIGIVPDRRRDHCCLRSRSLDLSAENRKLPAGVLILDYLSFCG